MELFLNRIYHPTGTNGKLFCDTQFVCFTIELPWLQNQRDISSIPEGRYRVTKRYTKTRGWHLHILAVPERSLILIHPANDALKELRGCIAPVSKLTGAGKGTSSREALNKLGGLLIEHSNQNEDLFLTIQIEQTMNIIKRVKAPTPKFFKVLRTIGLTIAAAGGAIMASPIALPAGLVALGGYLVAGGSVLSAVSQTAVDDNTYQND